MMKHNKSARLFQLLLVISLMMGMYPASAEMVTSQSNSTPTGLESSSPYRIVLTVPGGWTNNNTAVIKVSVTDREHLGWHSVVYRMNNKSWIDCQELFEQNKAQITVHENGTFALRITDPNGHQFVETAQVTTIDTTAPTVTADIQNRSLHINVRDDLSGVAGVQINSMLFTTVTGSLLDVDLDENMNKFEKLAVRAFDYAGNFSEPVTLDNPHYEKPAEPTPLPTATAKPTKKPVVHKEPVEEQPTSAPASVYYAEQKETEKPQRDPQHGLGSSLIYVSDDDFPEVTVSPTSVPTAAPTPEPIIQKEYITIGPGMPFQADGNSHTLDVLYSAATNKQFITVQSKNGNTFYLVIDYDKPIDEEAEIYETHFLNLVDERDLLALMSDEEKEEVPTPTPQIVYVTPVPTAVPVPTAPPAEEPPKKNQASAMIALVGLLALGGVGAFVLLKNKGNANAPRRDTDFDLEDDDDTEESDQSEE